MFEPLQRILSADPRIAYALVFGSTARRTAHRDSDLDVALGLSERLSTRELGDLAGRLESASGRPVDLVLMHEALPAVAYRVFRDGIVVVERDRDAMVRRKARAVMEYLDFKPIEDLCARGVLQAATRGR